MTLEYIAHASFRLEAHDGTSLIVDPYASRVWIGYDFPVAHLDADAVVITHPHFDHDYGEFIGRDVPWTSAQEQFRVPADGGELGAFALSGLEGRHAGPFGDEFGKQNTVWIVEHEGLRIVHWGDNETVDSSLARQLGRVDVLLLPIDGLEHLLTMEEVEDILAELQPRILIPMHYRLPDLEPSSDQPDDLGTIDPFIDGRDDVVVADASTVELSRSSLPAAATVLVLPPSPVVRAGVR